MNFNYINRKKIKKMSKYKLFVATYLLCGTLSLTGCSLLNNKIGNDMMTSTSIENQVEQEEQYSLHFVFKNLDYLEKNEEEFVVIYDKDGNMYGVFDIYNMKENYEIIVPVQDLRIKSHLLGRIDVYVGEGEKVFVYVDYLNRSLNVEKSGGVNNKVR